MIPRIQRLSLSFSEEEPESDSDRKPKPAPDICEIGLSETEVVASKRVQKDFKYKTDPVQQPPVRVVGLKEDMPPGPSLDLTPRVGELIVRSGYFHGIVYRKPKLTLCTRQISANDIIDRPPRISRIITYLHTRVHVHVLGVL
jgi:hypothetical protein